MPNTGVAIMANCSTMKKRNAEAADGFPKGSYAAVVASHPRITRSNRAAITRIKGDNTDVATNAPAARDAEEKPQGCHYGRNYSRLTVITAVIVITVITIIITTVIYYCLLG